MTSRWAMLGGQLGQGLGDSLLRQARFKQEMGMLPKKISALEGLGMTREDALNAVVLGGQRGQIDPLTYLLMKQSGLLDQGQFNGSSVDQSSGGQPNWKPDGTGVNSVILSDKNNTTPPGSGSQIITVELLLDDPQSGSAAGSVGSIPISEFDPSKHRKLN